LLLLRRIWLSGDGFGLRDGMWSGDHGALRDSSLYRLRPRKWRREPLLQRPLRVQHALRYRLLPHCAVLVREIGLHHYPLNHHVVMRGERRMYDSDVGCSSVRRALMGWRPTVVSMVD
jgi:hypothetical protein